MGSIALLAVGSIAWARFAPEDGVVEQAHKFELKPLQSTTSSRETDNGKNEPLLPQTTSDQKPPPPSSSSILGGGKAQLRAVRDTIRQYEAATGERQLAARRAYNDAKQRLARQSS